MMKLKEFDITLDIKKSSQMPLYEVVVGDYKTNIYNIKLEDDGQPYPLEGLDVEIAFAKPDRTTVVQDKINGVVIDGDSIRCTLASNTIAVPGIVYAEVRVLQDTKVLTSSRFRFYVRNPILNDKTVASSNEFPMLVQALEDAKGAAESLPEINLAIDNIRNAESELNQSIGQASALDDTLNGTIQSAEQVKDALCYRIETAGTAKTQLDDSISSASTSKSELDNSIAQAGTAKNELDGSIAQAGTVKGELDSSIATAGQTKTALDESIATGELAEFKDDFTSHLNDYATYKDSTTLKVAKVERELNDYKATMQQVNINQEPKQKVSGYGTVSLPKNAANGQISVVAKGNTYTNFVKNGNFANGTSSWASTTSGTLSANNNTLVHTGNGTNAVCAARNIGSLLKWEQASKIFIRATARVTNANASQIFLRVDRETGSVTVVTRINSPVQNQWYTLYGIVTRTDQSGKAMARIDHMYADAATANGKVMEVREVFVINLDQCPELANLTADQINTRIPHWFDSTKSTIGAFRIRSVSEDETQESSAYVIATDADTGEILELRSLPNGTKDEINVTDRKLIKRIGEKSNIANGMVIDFADMAEGGTYYAWNEDGETETGIKGDTLGIDATTLIYQLAEPIAIPVQVSGSIVSYPNGTIYIERILPDAGVYTDKISVLHQDAPIKRLDRLSKVDFYTGVETELDVSEAVIAEDKLSFTHPDLSEGDIVFFEYEYDVESTEGETEVEYYDSRYVVKDDVTGKFYKWNVKVSNGTPTIEVVEV